MQGFELETTLEGQNNEFFFFTFPCMIKIKFPRQINNRYSNSFQRALASLLFIHSLWLISFQQMFLLHREKVFPKLSLWVFLRWLATLMRSISGFHASRRKTNSTQVEWHPFFVTATSQPMKYLSRCLERRFFCEICVLARKLISPFAAH